jgi:Rrf2 family protein
MNVSTRFTIALHILTLLASMRDEAITSEFIAGSVNTNPVVIRRLLGLLRRARFVSSQSGKGGGWLLTRDPEAISLLAVRRAVNEGSPFTMHNQPPNPACPVGRHIQTSLSGVYGKVEQVMDAELAKTSVQDLVDSVRTRRRT